MFIPESFYSLKIVRECFEQFLCVGMLWLVIDRVHIGVFSGHTTIHHENRIAHLVTVVARMRPGATVTQTEAELPAGFLAIVNAGVVHAPAFPSAERRG